MLGAQIGDNLRHLLVCQGVGEGGHFPSAVENLVRHFGRSPGLVFADVRERRSFFATDSGNAVAIGATLVAKEDRAGFFSNLVFAAERSVGWCGNQADRQKKYGAGKKSSEQYHFSNIFALQRGFHLHPRVEYLGRGASASLR